MTTHPVKHLFTVDEYEGIGAAGLFAPDRRLELVEGEVIEMAPIGPAHASVVDRLSRLLGRVAGDEAVVRVQGPVRLSDVSEPQPDVALLCPRDDFYVERHPLPADLLLAVEVSDTTLAWDRSVKASLYARAGVVELWVVDVGSRTVEVCKGPSNEGYTQMRTAGRDDEIALSELAGVVIRVADFLG